MLHVLKRKITEGYRCMLSQFLVLQKTPMEIEAVTKREEEEKEKVSLSQWVKGISIDSLKDNYKLKSPDYVKIDVDGHETLVIKGAMKTISKGTVKSWAIEITDERDKLYYKNYEKAWIHCSR